MIRALALPLAPRLCSKCGNAGIRAICQSCGTQVWYCPACRHTEEHACPYDNILNPPLVYTSNTSTSSQF